MARMRKTFLAGLLAVVASIWGATTVSAQTPLPSPTPTPEPSLMIVSNSPQALLIGGMEIDKSPVNVSPGTNVCIADSVYYKSESERWTFEGWSSGSTQECIAPTRQGTYRAAFTHEVLLVVRS